MEYVDLVGIVAFVVALDIASGLLVAWSRQDMQSAKLRAGLLKKGGYVIAIALAAVLEVGADTQLGLEFPGVPVVCAAACMIDALSIVENLCILNPDLLDSPIGSWLANNKKIAEKTGDDSDGEDATGGSVA